MTTITHHRPSGAPCPEQYSAQRDRAELCEFLRGWRERADRDRFPLIGSPTRASVLRGVSQAQVAEALGVTEGYYRQIETGKRRLDARYLEPLVSLLQLTALERAVLYRLSQGGEPDTPPAPLVVDAQTRALIDALPFPAYASDAIWQIKHANAHLTAWFPSLKAGANAMLEATTNPAARRVLADYRESWLRPMLGLLRERISRAAEPDATELQTLAETILRRNPDAAQIWGAYPDTVYMHPAARVRPIHCHGTVQYVQLGANTLAGAAMSTMTWLVPLGPVPTRRGADCPV